MKTRTLLFSAVAAFCVAFAGAWTSGAMNQLAHVEGNQAADAVTNGATHTISDDLAYSIYVRSDTVSTDDTLFVHVQESPDGGTTWFEFVGADTLPGFTADSTGYIFQRGPGHAPLVRLTFDAEGSAIGGISWSYDIFVP